VTTKPSEPEKKKKESSGSINAARVQAKNLINELTAPRFETAEQSNLPNYEELVNACFKAVRSENAGVEQLERDLANALVKIINLKAEIDALSRRCEADELSLLKLSKTILAINVGKKLDVERLEKFLNLCWDFYFKKGTSPTQGYFSSRVVQQDWPSTQRTINKYLKFFKAMLEVKDDIENRLAELEDH